MVHWHNLHFVVFLYINFSPSLSWRDVQYLIVNTSSHESLNHSTSLSGAGRRGKLTTIYFIQIFSPALSSLTLLPMRVSTTQHRCLALRRRGKLTTISFIQIFSPASPPSPSLTHLPMRISTTQHRSPVLDGGVSLLRYLL